MHKSVRQSMAWLHSWLGLSFGWLLFAIFLTGAVTYYRHEISIWMQPEFATMQVNQETALKICLQLFTAACTRCPELVYRGSQSRFTGE